MVLLAIGLFLALLTVLLRRVYGLRYWTVAIGLMALTMGTLQWLLQWQKAAGVCVVAFPIGVVFACANPGTMRARPWLIMLVVPVAFAGSVFAGALVGVDLQVLAP